jgi:uncharacterized protein YdaU (DUF1376 family)
MPAKWQQWMPFKIDAFKSSPAVQAMHPCARIGYLYLLACEWQTDDCTIPSDPLDLAEMSGLGDELWAIHGPRILRKFDPTQDGRLTNQTCRREWEEAKKVFEARQKAADRTNNNRWSIGDRTVTERGPNRSADTRTGTGTGTVKQFPRGKREAVNTSIPLETWSDGAVAKREKQRNAEAVEGYRMWQGMSETYRAKNPWKGPTA